MPKQFNNRKKYYDLQSIKQWRYQINQIPSDIENLTQKIDKDKTLKHQDKEALKELEAGELSTIEKRIEKINAQLQVLTLPQKMHDLTIKIDPLKQQFRHEENAVNAIKETIAGLDSKIENLEKSLKRQKEIIELENNRIMLENKNLHHISTKNQLVSDLKAEALTLNSVQQSIIQIESQLATIKNQANSSYTSSQNQSSANSCYASSVNQDYTSSVGDNQQQTSAQVTTSNTGTYSNTSETLRLQDQLSDLRQKKINIENSIKHFNNTLAKKEQEINGTTIEINQLQQRSAQFSLIERQAAHQKQKELSTAICEQKETRAPFIQRQATLEENLAKLKTELHNINGEVERLKASLNYYSERTGEYKDIDDLSQLQRDLYIQKEIQAPYLAKKQQFLKQINEYTKSITKNDIHLAQLKQEQINLQQDQLMQRLWNQPDALIDQFSKMLENALKTFEMTYPAKQSENVRLAIAECHKNKEVITSQPLPQPAEIYRYPDLHRNEIEQATLEYKQNKYYQLCGLLWSLRSRLVNSEDEALASLLEQILSEHAIAENLGKPRYEELKLPAIGIHDLYTQELSQYEQAREEFATLLNELSSNQSKEVKQAIAVGNHLINEIEIKKTHDLQKDVSAFDYKFYSNIFTHASILTRQPDDIEAQKRFKKFISQTDHGKPSLSKKIGGALMMFFGAVLTIGGIATGLLLSPLCATGSLVGVSLFCGGLGVTMHGRDKGIHRSLSTYLNASTKNHFFASNNASAASQPEVATTADTLVPKPA